jgi:hypothetical protein
MGEVVVAREPDYQPDKIHRLFDGVKHLFCSISPRHVLRCTVSNH